MVYCGQYVGPWDRNELAISQTGFVEFMYQVWPYDLLPVSGMWAEKMDVMFRSGS